MKKLSLALCLIAVFAFGQEESTEVIRARAGKAYQEKRLADAERDFREVVKRDPSDMMATMFLGHSLFFQQKVADAIGPYEKTRELERSGKKLNETWHRALIDQLTIAYGMSGQLKKAHALLAEAIKEDPDYPLFYYNDACTYAEEGNKKDALVSLDLALQRKDKMIKSETFPDPRKDDSFKKLVADPDFVALMKKYGYT